jgi:hypothetical protein
VQFRKLLSLLLSAAAIVLQTSPVGAEMRTWDGRHKIDRIELTVAYFVPRDRTPLPDWRERVDYYCRRIEKFHHREFQGQSKLTTRVQPEPFRSARTTQQLRSGDGDFIFFQTLREVDSQTEAPSDKGAFPILLVLSDINWRPLEDFYRLRSIEGKLEFEGQFIDGRHHPGAASGGARATYLADRGMGWGLVSADGWRVPYCGSDCVIYHEGLGHTVGLPHPEPGNGSVMSLAQYRGWISESWLDDDQKQRLGWTAPAEKPDRKSDLFSIFRAFPSPLVPRPGEEVSLNLVLPEAAKVGSCSARIQTELFGPWVETDASASGAAELKLRLGKFDRPTPVSYRVDVELEDGQSEELWGYFQVRATPEENPLPHSPSREEAPAQPSHEPLNPDAEVDLLSMIDVSRGAVQGEWTFRDGRLDAPKAYGARIEIPYQPAQEYQLVVVAEPLDNPNGLILGQRAGDHRFVVLVNFLTGGGASSALENIDGRNVGNNPTTFEGTLLKRGRLSQIICTVRKESVKISVDGRQIIDWAGKPEQLSLSDYWKTPRDNALFLGAYDCRYRFHRVTLTPLAGEGKKLVETESQSATQ